VRDLLFGEEPKDNHALFSKRRLQNRTFFKPSGAEEKNYAKTDYHFVPSFFQSFCCGGQRLGEER